MTFEDHWDLVRHGNPALADDVFAEHLARTAWEAATKAEREACAKVCESLFDSDDDSCNEAETCAETIRARSNHPTPP